MVKPITIATSIAPKKDIDNQIKAVESWKKAGFKVVSLNVTEEQQALKPYFPDIEFIIVQRDASDKFRKPYIYIDDILNYLGGCNAEICGIVNSDIHLVKKEFYSFLEKNAIASMVYGSRIDVDDLQCLAGEMIHDGFDYFFFDKNIIVNYPPVDLFMGLPCWDYWAILVPLFCGVPIKKVITHHAYHIKHKVNWDNTASRRLYQYSVLKYFKPLSPLAISPYYMLGLIHKYSLHITLAGKEQPLCQPDLKQLIKSGHAGTVIDQLLFIK